MTDSLANELAIHNFTRREKASESTFKQRHLQKIMPITGSNVKGCLIFVRILIYFLIFELYSNNEVRSQTPNVKCVCDCSDLAGFTCSVRVIVVG